MEPGLLKYAAPLIAGAVDHICNWTLLSGSDAKAWKSAYVLTLHKGWDTNDLDNYHPISRQPCLAKIFESLVNVQFHSFLSDNCILNINQSGFRPGDSTTTAATLVVNDLVIGC